MTNEQFFPRNSTITFISGGYFGGQERTGTVLGIEANRWGTSVMVAFEDGAKEGFPIESLRRDIERGRIPGSLACTLISRFEPPKSSDPTADFNCSDMFE